MRTMPPSKDDPPVDAAAVARRWAVRRMLGRLALTAPLLVALCVMATALVGGAVVRMADAFSRRAEIGTAHRRGEEASRPS